jgi:hypothetical protein
VGGRLAVDRTALDDPRIAKGELLSAAYRGSRPAPGAVGDAFAKAMTDVPGSRDLIPWRRNCGGGKL